MPSLNIEKFANAFATDATPSAVVGGVALNAVNSFGQKHGGLWVGGKVKATAEGLRFTPNARNKAFHVGLESAHIPIASIRAVTREFGWLTGIVVVQHTEEGVRFRCFGAKQVAATLGAYVATL